MLFSKIYCFLNSSILAVTSSSVPSKVCVSVFSSPFTLEVIVTTAPTLPEASLDFSTEIFLRCYGLKTTAKFLHQ